MTRLVSDQVKNISGRLKAYDLELKSKTGATLKGLALSAAGLKKDDSFCPEETVAVVPITAGQGVIGFFSEAISAIAAHLGFKARVTAKSDVAGLAEAYQSGAGLVIMADDFLYTAINLKTRRVIDNDEATVAGYCTALQKMTGGLKKKKVLLIGAGPVGQAAACRLILLGAELIVYDLKRAKENLLAALIKQRYQTEITRGLNLKEALSVASIIFDASTGDRFIKARELGENTYVAAPGIPLGFDEAACKKIQTRLVHDCLEIGTAVMLFSALA